MAFFHERGKLDAVQGVPKLICQNAGGLVCEGSAMVAAKTSSYAIVQIATLLLGRPAKLTAYLIPCPSR